MSNIPARLLSALVLFVSLVSPSVHSQQFECLISSSGQSASEGSQIASGTILRPVVIFCADPDAYRKDIPPAYLQAPGFVADYYQKVSFGNYGVEIAGILAADSAKTKAIVSSYALIWLPRTDPNWFRDSYIAHPAFVRDILTRADTLYHFGQFDNDGPDGLPNSGDDDGFVDFVIFELLWRGGAGTTGLSINSTFTTQDTSRDSQGNFRGYIKIDGSNYGGSGTGRAIMLKLDFVPGDEPTADKLIMAWFHELGHTPFGFSDLDHSYLTPFDHSALGSFESMAADGFKRRASLYNPKFREGRGWVSSTPLTTSLLSVDIGDFDSLGTLYRYTPTSQPAGTLRGQQFYVNFYVTPHSAWNRWKANWPIPQAAGGLMIWHKTEDGIWSDWRRMPIDIESAHGKFIWNDTSNTGVQNSLVGRDSLEIRKVSGETILWEPYRNHSSGGRGSETSFFIPNSGKEFGFYTNPNSNFYRELSGEYSQAVTSGFSVKNITVNGGKGRVDLLVNDGTVTQNATVAPGTWFIQRTIDVQPGVTLTISPGAVLKFEPSTSLNVRGKLIAQGTSWNPIMFTSSSPSTKWSGILITGSGANGSKLEYATVNNVLTYGGSAVSVVGATGVSIKYCNISNNTANSTTALFFTDAGSPEVAYCKMNGNGRYGIGFQNTNGNLYRDTLQGNSTAGVYCSNYASPSFGKIGFPAYNGNNIISGSPRGLYLELHSSPYVGTQQSSNFGYNSITSTSIVRVYANFYCSPLAEMNWWGTESPTSNMFQATGNSTIDWQPYLSYDPFDPRAQAPLANGGAPEQTALTVTGNEITSTLQSAMDARAAGNYQSAKTQLLSLLASAQTTDEKALLYAELVALYRENGNQDLLRVCLEAWAKDQSDPEIGLCAAKMLAVSGNSVQASRILQTVAASNTDGEAGFLALLDLFYIACVTGSSPAQANDLLKELQNRSADHPAITQAAWVASMQYGGSVGLSKSGEDLSEGPGRICSGKTGRVCTLPGISQSVQSHNDNQV